MAPTYPGNHDLNELESKLPKDDSIQNTAFLSFFLEKEFSLYIPSLKLSLSLSDAQPYLRRS